MTHTLPETFNINGVTYTKKENIPFTKGFGFSMHYTSSKHLQNCSQRERFALTKCHDKANDKLDELKQFDNTWRMVETEVKDTWFFYKKSNANRVFIVAHYND